MTAMPLAESTVWWLRLIRDENRLNELFGEHRGRGYEKQLVLPRMRMGLPDNTANRQLVYAYIERLLKETNIAFSMADDIDAEFGQATFYSFETPDQMRGRLSPLRNALMCLRDERYQSHAARNRSCTESR